MPLELQVIRASEFVRLDAHAHLDLEASKRVLQGLAHACRKRGVVCALLDLRKLPVPPKPHFTPKELAALVSTFHDAGFSRPQRLAVLYQHDVHGGIRNFAFFSRMRGLDVQAFTDFETAFLWLTEAQQGKPEHASGEIPVPITQRRVQTQRLAVGVTEAAPGRSTPRRVRRTIHYKAA
jgi:hypothetical protein